MKTNLSLLFAMGLIITAASCASHRGFPAVSGIDNFDVVDAHLCRGAQPNHIGIERLKDMGVKTVINLRQASDTWQDESNICASAGMAYYSVPLNPIAAPSIGAVDRILKLIGDTPDPVFVHCQFGCERTGTIVACYRIRNGMSNEAALNDAKLHGISDWAVPMMHFITHFR